MFKAKPGSERRRGRVGVERLEGRELLSGSAAPISSPRQPPTITLALSPSSDPAGDNTVTGQNVIVTGQTTATSIVQLTGAGRPLKTFSNGLGQFQFHIRLGLGQTPLTAQVTDDFAQNATANLTVTRANQVIVWNAIALQAIRNAKSQPPDASRALAMVETAVYGAVNAVEPIGSTYHVVATAQKGASPDAAAAAAAEQVLASLYPQQAPVFEAELAASLASIRGGAAKVKGVAVGDSAASQILAWRANDGSNLTVGYIPGTQPGQWRPTPPGNAPALEPQWGIVTPFALTCGGQFRPAPPPAITSPAYAAALQQVQAIGSANSTTRTADQTQIAKFWADNNGTETPPGHWNSIAETVAVQSHDSLAKDARVFALLDIAEADAAIACWDAKYTDNLWRPITAIRDASAIGNPQLTSDPTWTPLLNTPPFPSYVSGHSTFSGAACEVLTAIYGNVSFKAGSDALPGVTRTYTSFQQAAMEAGMSRIYAGIHYSFDNDAGMMLGQEVGRYVLANELLPATAGRSGK